MPVHLLQQIFERTLDRGFGSRSFRLHRHLARRQTQVQRNAGAFARQILLDCSLQMHQFGPEDLQAFAQFFNLVLDVFLYGGSLMKTITDMDVHEHLGVTKLHATKCYLRRLYTRSKKGKSELSEPFHRRQGS